MLCVLFRNVIFQYQNLYGRAHLCYTLSIPSCDGPQVFFLQNDTVCSVASKENNSRYWTIIKKGRIRWFGRSNGESFGWCPSMLGPVLLNEWFEWLKDGPQFHNLWVQALGDHTPYDSSSPSWLISHFERIISSCWIGVMVMQVAAVAVLCVQPEPSYRPLITDVLHSLIPLVPVELGGTLRVTEPAPHACSNSSAHWLYQIVMRFFYSMCFAII